MKRALCILLSVLLLAAGALPALAAPRPKVSLEQAVKIAKKAFPVPEELTEFESNYSFYGDEPRWDLSWRAPSGSTVGGQLNISVDADYGDILSMNIWRDDSAPKAVLPKYSRTEAEKLAREVAAKIQPLFSETRLVERIDEQFWGGPISEYSFQFERMVNGYPYPDNSISIRVDANKFEVVSYRFTWDRNLDFPLPDNIIDHQQAEELFLTKAAPRLIYFRPNPEGNKERPIKLVYDLSRTTGYIVDAQTGEIKLHDNWYGPADMGALAKEQEARGMALPELSPAEQAEVDKLAELLTQEQAMAKVKQMFKISSKTKLEHAHLSKSWEYPLQRQWNFSWGFTEKNIGGESVSAGVDARTGDVLQYNYYRWSADGDKKPAVKYNKEEAEKIARDFIFKYQPDRFAACKLEEIDQPAVPLPENEQRSYSFAWVRYVNGIPFPQQGFRLVVSAETGAITSYNMIWSDHDFPDPEGAMAQEDADQKVLGDSPLTLEYLSVPQWEKDYTIEPEIKLGLYYHIRLQNLLGMMMDAKSGDYLDNQGDLLPDRDQPLFTDLEDHPAAGAVALLASKNIVQGAPDGLFHPDEAITQPAYLVMLLRTTGFQPRGEVEEGPWYKKYEKEARRQRILTDEDKLDPAATITREEAAVWTVRALGQDRIATLQNIWNVPAEDRSSIGYPGHVALYLGQNLDPDQQTSFRPGGVLTRAQAAEGMVLFLHCERY